MVQATSRFGFRRFEPIWAAAGDLQLESNPSNHSLTVLKQWCDIERWNKTLPTTVVLENLEGARKLLNSPFSPQIYFTTCMSARDRTTES